MTYLLIWCSSHLQGNSFQVLLTKLRTSTCTFSFQNLSSHYVVGHQVVQPCTCKEYIGVYSSWVLPRITIPPLQQLWISKERIILDCITSHNHKKTSTNHITNLYWLALQLGFTKVMTEVMALFLAWAVVSARPVARAIEQKSWHICLQVLPNGITLSVLAIFASN